MSETGLFASGYKRVTDYARSVDRLLLDLKSEVQPSEETVAPVITILEAMQAEASAPPLVRLLFRRWKDRVSLTVSQIGAMISELRTQQVSTRTIDHLEELARSLDQERADIRFRLRGVGSPPEIRLFSVKPWVDLFRGGWIGSPIGIRKIAEPFVEPTPGEHRRARPRGPAS